MSLRQKLENGSFLVTTEVGPPKGTSLENILKELDSLRSKIDAVNVTDLQSSVMRMGALAAAVLLKNSGFEPVVQMTCRDRNRLALQADLLSAAALGLENILALTGDHPSLGDHPQAKPVFDLDAVQLIEGIRCLEKGQDLAGNKLVGPFPRYCVGGVVNPGSEFGELELIKMEKKIAAGCDFFQTQAIFEADAFDAFLKKCSCLRPKIIAGIVVLKSEKMARFMNEKVPGMNVPEALIQELAQASDKKKKGIEIAVRLIRQLKDRVLGVHIMSIGWYQSLEPILNEAGLLRSV